MTERRRIALAAPAMLLVACCAGSEPTFRHPRPTAPLAATPASEVEEEFAGVCAAMLESDNEYYGRGRLEELRGYLPREHDAPAPARAVLRAQLAMEHLRWGESARARELLESARSIAVSERLPEPLVADITRRLALAELRVGEQAHCIALHDPESCIVPFRAGAVHRDPRAAKRALALYRDLVRDDPDPVLRWLALVAAMAAGEPPPAGTFSGTSGPGRLPDVAARRGFALSKPSGGAVADDFDGDGDIDVITSTIDPCGSMSFFVNRGDGTFEERTGEAGLAGQLGGLNLIHADYDNDGDNDVLVLRGGWMGADGRLRNSLLRNDGGGRFDDVTAAAGIAHPAYPTQTAAFADYDLDGDLDLYVGNESDESLYAGGAASQAAYPSQLFRNEGDGTFTDVAGEAGVTNGRFAKGVAWGDYDDDGDPDLYVSNIGPNRLYRNEGDGRFTDVAGEAGVTQPEGRSFTTWFFDVEADGDLDLFVADYGATLAEVAADLLGATVAAGRPRLYLNRGDGTFRDTAARAGFSAPLLVMGANYGDLDGDGLPDLYLGTGAPSFESLMPNRLYLNLGDGAFADVTYASGVGHLQKGHGVAFADFDRDGDVDLLQQMGGAYPGDAFPSTLYDNPGSGNAWTRLKLVGTRSNRSAIGARVTFESSGRFGERRVEARVGSGGSFGGSPLTLHVGLGAAERIDRIRVRWPLGDVEHIDDVPLRADLVLVEGERRIRRPD